eukprot:maker-scaffold_2-snap-gene-6.48-mRNA-1 protein AED:0.06 eAED:0.09 QI:0/0/0/1/0/0.5/2/0/363
MYTPLIPSPGLAEQFGLKNVFLKMENCQATGSFKDRAMLELCRHLKLEQWHITKSLEVVCSSGGNAGLAAAHACKLLNLSCRVFVPESTKQLMLQRIRSFNPEAIIVKAGMNLDEATDAAKKYLAEQKQQGKNVAYAPPFDHPKIWKGNSRIYTELKSQINDFRPQVDGVEANATSTADQSAKVDGIFCSVGGGGLAAGLLLGLMEEDGCYQHKTKLFCAETQGAESFRAAWGNQGELFSDGVEIPALNEIKSIAHSLGAKKVAKGFLDLCKEYNNVDSVVVSDSESVEGIEVLLAEHRVLVEPACGASVAALKKAVETGLLDKSSSVVVIVCGGSAISNEIIQTLKNSNLAQSGSVSTMKYC